MKKLIVSSIAVVCLTVLAACNGGGGAGGNASGGEQNEKGTQEESIVGKWKSQISKSEMGGKIETTINLEMKADKTMNMDVVAVLDGEQKGIKIKVPMNMGYDGKWDATSEKVVFTPDTTTAHFSVNKHSLVIELKDSKLNAMANMVKDMLADELAKNNKSKMMVRYTPNDSMAYFLDNSELLLITNKDTLRFKRN